MNTWELAVRRRDAAQAELRDCRALYREAKDHGKASTVFTAAVVLAEASLLADEAEQKLEEIALEMETAG